MPGVTNCSVLMMCWVGRRVINTNYSGAPPPPQPRLVTSQQDTALMTTNQTTAQHSMLRSLLSPFLRESYDRISRNRAFFPSSTRVSVAKCAQFKLMETMGTSVGFDLSVGMLILTISPI